MQSKALILHAWYSQPQDHWYPWLKKELENKDYEVLLPELPTMNTDFPDMEKIINSVEDFITDETVIIGHSLGCLLAMRLAERMTYQRMILVAGWDFDDLTAGHKLFWSTKIDHQRIKFNVKDISVIHSENDPYITPYLAEEMSKRLDGKFILVKGAGHFTKDDGITQIPQIVNLL